MLPLAEIRVALLDVLKENFGASLDQIVQAVARGFGFKSTSTPLREKIEAAVRTSQVQGEITEKDGLFVLAD
jgi:hypothetical protein